MKRKISAYSNEVGIKNTIEIIKYLRKCFYIYLSELDIRLHSPVKIITSVHIAKFIHVIWRTMSKHLYNKCKKYTTSDISKTLNFFLINIVLKLHQR